MHAINWMKLGHLSSIIKVAATLTHFSVIINFQVTKWKRKIPYIGVGRVVYHFCNILLGCYWPIKPRVSLYSQISMYSFQSDTWHEWHYVIAVHSPGNTISLLCPSAYTNTWVDVVLRYPINTWITLTSKSAKQSKGRVWWTLCRNTYNREKRLYTKITH